MNMQAINHAGKRFDVAVTRHGQLTRQTGTVVFIDTRDAGNQQS